MISILLRYSKYRLPMKTLILLIVIFSTIGCTCSNNASIESTLLQHAISDDSEEQYKSCIFLGELLLTEVEIKKINKEMESSICKDLGYPITFLPPYFELLISLSSTSDLALDKLVSTLNPSNAALTESTIDSLSRLYAKDTQRVMSSFIKNNTSKSLITLTIDTASYYEGENKNE
jgi:hypothetical protein